MSEKDEQKRAEKLLEEIKNANDEYKRLNDLLIEKKRELEKIQEDAYIALQKCALMNEGYLANVNTKLLLDFRLLKEELEKIKNNPP